MLAAAPHEFKAAGRYGANARSRRPALALAVALHVLVALVLLYVKREPLVRMAQPALNTFNIAPEPSKSQETDKSKARTEQKAEAKREAAVAQPAAVQPPPPPVPEAPKDLQMPFIVLSRSDYAASDIGKKPSQRVAAADAGTQGGAAGPGAGAGPGGATLYPADWFRRPTSTELQFYLRPTQPRTGWGLIACKTIERYRVDECYILDESPRGSGFGRSVLAAAWQFQVQPPRINGRPQVGSWVSIRIEYYEAGANAD